MYCVNDCPKTNFWQRKLIVLKYSSYVTLDATIKHINREDSLLFFLHLIVNVGLKR
jgi:hypothetical protein